MPELIPAITHSAAEDAIIKIFIGDVKNSTKAFRQAMLNPQTLDIDGWFYRD
jgi:hypothetical protein